MNVLGERDWGVVLAGGGAKGAYQVGALKYLAEQGFSPQIIAGTSIGALNGAVIAGKATLEEGVDRLEALWTRLGNESVLQPNLETVSLTAGQIALLFTPTARDLVIASRRAYGTKPLSLFDPAPIERLMREAIDPEAVRRGTELWITVFESVGTPHLVCNVPVDLLRAGAGAQAEWLHANQIQPNDALHEALLASAAVPLAFPPRKIEGRTFIDGGIADNVPLGALAQRGCRNVIVIHLGNGEAWDRNDFVSQSVVEIRPVDPIQSDETPFFGWTKALLDFSPSRIAELRERGYRDAKRIIEDILRSRRVLADLRKTTVSIQTSTAALQTDPSLRTS